jgi:hypothetical protein
MLSWLHEQMQGLLLGAKRGDMREILTNLMELQGTTFNLILQLTDHLFIAADRPFDPQPLYESLKTCQPLYESLKTCHEGMVRTEELINKLPE